MGSQKKTIRKRRTERKHINTRAVFLLALMGVCVSGIGYRVYDLQFTQKAKQSEVVKGNAIKELYISPERGDIVDRNGVIIADSRPFYDLVVIPERISGYRSDRSEAIRSFIDSLGHFVDFGDSRSSVIRDLLKAAPYQNVIVKRDLNDDDLNVVLSNIGFIDGISIKSKKVRHYPFGDAFLSPLGYVSRVDANDLKRASEDGYKLLAHDYTGKMGLERIYNKSLYGNTGVERVALNARGRVVERQIASQPKKGETLHLSLDAHLQLKARELMEGKRGAILMSDINTGELLVSLSMPSVDPNKFVKGISSVEAKSIFSESAGRPLYNRTIRGQYPPASTAKPFMALAGLEGGFINPDDRVWSGPYFELGGHRFRDWKRQGHGWVRLNDAMEVSSDVYFYRLADKMGINYIHDYLYEFGFGHKTGIELEREGEGLLPNSDWKRRVKKLPWYGGETITVGIGQGYFMSTPIQMQSAFVTLLNGGKRLKPLLIKSDSPVVQSELSIDENHRRAVMESMEKVVYGKRGTARRQGRDKKNVIKFAGKTGTGQVISSGGTLEYENEDLPLHQRDHAWFSGYVPMDDPKVAITVFIEHGKSGSGYAAPIAKELLNEYAKRYLGAG
ncbi:penicillin-binding protein 2 [Vibrio sp. D431a]|uniref:penicillin-binding protein 2 n=1 Tax=Vibrio sp. D431a TaxID=2837388 RepID=UPI0025558AAF|nr:penicillin-binding protein 2 [Vibrio sp. D431a]MDK9793263.1 penicillin-binding protein 2 [Vibrio sp. D431a]